MGQTMGIVLDDFFRRFCVLLRLSLFTGLVFGCLIVDFRFAGDDTSSGCKVEEICVAPKS